MCHVAQAHPTLPWICICGIHLLGVRRGVQVLYHSIFMDGCYGPLSSPLYLNYCLQTPFCFIKLSIPTFICLLSGKQRILLREICAVQALAILLSNCVLYSWASPGPSCLSHQKLYPWSELACWACIVLWSINCTQLWPCKVDELSMDICVAISCEKMESYSVFVCVSWWSTSEIGFHSRVSPFVLLFDQFSAVLHRSQDLSTVLDSLKRTLQLQQVYAHCSDLCVCVQHMQLVGLDCPFLCFVQYS